MTFKTVEQMEAEIKELKGLRKKDFKTGAKQERAKIVAWLRDGVAMSDVYINHVEARELAQYIEAGEHLK